MGSKVSDWGLKEEGDASAKQVSTPVTKHFNAFLLNLVVILLNNSLDYLQQMKTLDFIRKATPRISLRIFMKKSGIERITLLGRSSVENFEIPKFLVLVLM